MIKKIIKDYFSAPSMTAKLHIKIHTRRNN